MNANWTRDVWNGAAETDEWKQWPAVKARFPVEAAKIPWEHYSHYASLVGDNPCPCMGGTACLRDPQKHRRRSTHPELQPKWEYWSMCNSFSAHLLCICPVEQMATSLPFTPGTGPAQLLSQGHDCISACQM